MKHYTQYYAGSLTGLDDKAQEEFLKLANEKIKAKRIEKIHISIEPNIVTKELLKKLKANNVITVELEIKSTNDFVLRKCNAGFLFEDIKKASKLIKRARLNLGYQVMVGMPDTTKIDEQEEAKLLIKFKPYLVRIYPVVVTKGSELEQKYKAQEYEPLTIQQAVERCKDMVYIFNKKKIDAISIGYIGERLKQNEKNEIKIIAGPAHEAFNQLVEDSIWYDAIIGKIKNYNMKVKEVKIEVHPSNVNNILGYEKENSKKIKELYSVDINVLANEEVKPGRSQMRVTAIYED